LSHYERRLKEKHIREQAQYKVILEEITGKHAHYQPAQHLKKKRASYSNTWQTQVRNFDSKNNASRDDF
jgi:ATP-dependent exoDNAse (exonuclease V) alpha subunit